MRHCVLPFTNTGSHTTPVCTLRMRAACFPHIWRCFLLPCYTVRSLVLRTFTFAAAPPYHHHHRIPRTSAYYTPPLLRIVSLGSGHTLALRLLFSPVRKRRTAHTLVSALLQHRFFAASDMVLCRVFVFAASIRFGFAAAWFADRTAFSRFKHTVRRARFRAIWFERMPAARFGPHLVRLRTFWVGNLCAAGV